MNHIDYLTSLYDLEGRAVLDVGAGKGEFARQLYVCGATVTGVEIDGAKVAAARSDMPDGVTIVEGRGEDIPAADHTVDLVCFIFSFHHVPVDVHDRALGEVERVLKRGGRLHLADPLPEGTMFDVVKLVEDETIVRTRSHQRLRRIAGEGRFDLRASQQYVLEREFPDLDAFIDRIVATDPARAARLPEVADRLKQTFDNRAIDVNGASRLDQPCVAYHFGLNG